MTHLTTLTSLHAYYRERPMMAFWRVFFMGLMLLLLVIALIPSGHLASIWGSFIPAVCLYSEWHAFGVFNKPIVAFSLVMLLTSYSTRVVKLFTPLSGFAHKWLRIAPGNLLKNCFDRAQRLRDRSSGVMEKYLWTSLQFSLTIAYVFLKAIYDISESMLWEVCIPTGFVMV